MSLFIGLMSGTSLDAVDAALVRVHIDHPPELIASHGEAMPDELRAALYQLCHANQVSFAELARAEDAFCRLQATAVQKLLKKAQITANEIRAIGSHGQTIEHAPGGYDGGPAYTWQLDNPSLLAELTGCCVVGDFRRRDLAANGQAAPLAPAFHTALFRHPEQWRLVLNLGGFANLTVLPPASDSRQPLGFDTGPANALMDAWIERHLGEAYDKDGSWAASGQVDEALLSRCLADPFFSQPPPRSTGREYFHLDWLNGHLRGDERSEDVQATLSALTAASVAQGVDLAMQTFNASTPAALFACGGGASNIHLMTRLAHHLPGTEIYDTSRLGWSADWLEAAAFAWLAWRRLEHLPGNLPSVTGARGPRILGGVYSP
ncbi:anhydro-N-acetylmuramic acid kinase [Halomonas halocynthiae]|uniref:anhydro-N-acetylmuramic acid kinase n=1 Tax=Halomonas halocynthiae TaxID=176290 RepID=UPI000416A825|nr:anhydro-N-acetylmuramic acid kinase [Halomonas halocynthiae]